MSRVSSNDPDDDFAVEITSLDAPETPVSDSISLLQGSHLNPRIRLWLTILLVVGGLLLIFVVLSPILSSLLPKETRTAPAIHPPTQIQDVTVQNGIAYITTSNGSFRALRMKNGSLLWQRNLVGAVSLFTNDTIYIDYYSKQKSIVQALRANDGSVLWTFHTSLDVSPLIIDNGTIYPLSQFSSQGHILTALDSKNGAELWHYAMNVTQSQDVYTQAMQDKIYVVVGGASQTPSMDLFVLKSSDGTLLWHIKAASIQLIQDDVIGITTNDDVLKVLRADNGHEIWHYKAFEGMNLSGGDFFYIQTQEGSLQALRPDSGASVWTYKDRSGITQVFPGVNGVLYLETGDDFVVALRTSDGKQLWRVQPISSPFSPGLIQVEDGIVYSFITVPGAQDETVVALRPNDGTILWKRQVATSNNTSPQVFNDLLLADSGSTITLVRARDGVVLWHADYTQTASQSSSGFLALADNIVILRLSDSVVEAHQLETGAVLWRYPH